MPGSTSSTSNNWLLEFLNSSNENDCSECTTRCVGRTSNPGSFMLTNVIITNSYGASGSLAAAFSRHSLRKFSAVS